MSDLTLESLAKRVEALERVIATNEPDQSSQGSAQKVVGTSATVNSCAKSTRNACGSARPNGRRRGVESCPNDTS